MLSANSSLFVELMDHLLAELKLNASHSTTRTFIQCIGAIWLVKFMIQLFKDINFLGCLIPEGVGGGSIGWSSPLN